MTENERTRIMARIIYLLNQHREAVVASVVMKLSSGGIDPDSYDLTDYSLPKVLVTSALHDHKDDYTPIYGPHQDDLENLSHF